MSYCAGPVVGSGHTFSTYANYAPLEVLAFSGAAASPFDQSSNNYVSGGTANPGAITPSVPNALMVTGVGSNNWTGSVDSGFAISDSSSYISSVSMGGAVAWLVVATPASINPGWANSADGGVGMLSFKGA